MLLAVCGLHLTGAALNHQLVTAGARLFKATKTVNKYTMHALSVPGSPSKPGMIFHPLGGPHCNAISVEVWDIPDEKVGWFLQCVPPPLGFGTVFLEDDSKVYGFVCEGWAADEAAAAKMGIVTENITTFGGWREWEATHKKINS